VSDIGIVLSASGNIPCVFINLVGLPFKKICHLKSRVSHPRQKRSATDEGASTGFKLSGHGSERTIGALITFHARDVAISSAFAFRLS
jgi:hypothetical protein